MKKNARFIEVNGRELRIRRLSRGWTQRQLARSAGYTERLIRKAEIGGTLDIKTVQDLAEALSTPDNAVAVASLTVDIAAIARRWMEAWAQHEAQMVSKIASYLAEGFEFVCPGEPGTVPFVGTFKGTFGLQQWMELYFSHVQREQNMPVEYMVGDDSVMCSESRTCRWNTWLAMTQSSPVGWSAAHTSACPPRRCASTCIFALWAG
jgi:transcriptional regulator with XRE-family HTH domain